MRLWHLYQNLDGLFSGNVRMPIIPNINAFSREFDPKIIVLKFWDIESYGVLEKQKPKQFGTIETTCFKHLRKKRQQTLITPVLHQVFFHEKNV